VTTVVVLGATGEMGERVCTLLRRWVPAVQVIGANRSGRGHRDFPVRRAEVGDEAALRALLGGVDLVVNAVGPYRYDPAPLLRACIDARCHYADLAEDLDFLARVERLARARDAARAGVCVLPGCSTAPGLVQLAAGCFGTHGGVAAVSAWLSLGSRNPVSRGLLAGLLGPLGRKGPDGRRYFTRTALLETSEGRSLRFGSYPAPFPGKGLRLGERRVPVSLRVGFDRSWLTRALAGFAPLLGRLPRRMVPALAGLALPLARVVGPLGTWRGALVVRAEGASGQELGRVEIHAMRNGLDIPAAPPVWVAQRLAREGRLPAAGVVGLDRIVRFGAAAEWLAHAGYRVTRLGIAAEGALP
jgi:hypothetical protein